MSDAIGTSLHGVLHGKDLFAEAVGTLVRAAGRFSSATPSDVPRGGETDLAEAAVRVTISKVGVEANLAALAAALELEDETLRLLDPNRSRTRSS
ncbi:MAG: hypothetical protein A2284_07660 [Deltaproteobacteria bacterium RIFOXYA12_FULL_61_11]|nr:MAG: hypothetical protein A2284_07660 [Deltaproteobacteria bacterium RIFOXYA12_FULL_61_11]